MHWLHQLQVQQTTLLVWLLGGGAHVSWFDVVQYQWGRHAAKQWVLSAQGALWDDMVLRLVWRFVGHVLRKPAGSLAKAALIRSLAMPPAQRMAVRRYRTGPDNHSHARLLRYVRALGLDPEECAQNRGKWKQMEQQWVDSWGVRSRPTGHHVLRVDESFMLTPDRALQGAFRGSQTMFASWDAGHLLLSMTHLHRTHGWQEELAQGPRESLPTMLERLVLHFVSPATFHVRLVLSFPFSLPPCAFPAVWDRAVVVEFSAPPPTQPVE